MNNTFDLFSDGIHFLIFAGFGYFLVQMTWLHQSTIGFQQRLFLLAITIRFVTSLVIYEMGFINTIKDEDGSGWVVGTALRQSWEMKGFSLFDAPWLFLESYLYHHRGYYYLLGVLYLITGLPGRLPAASLNCLIGSLTVVFVYRVSRSLFSEEVSRKAAWMCCLFPSLIIWSAQTLKEPVVIFLETVALYSCVQLRVSGFATRHIVLVGMSAVLLYPFRFYASYLASGTVLVALLLPRFGKGQSNFLSAIAVTGIMGGFILTSGIQVTKEVQQHSFDLEYLEKMKNYTNRTTGSSVEVKADLKSPTGMAYHLIVGVLHLMMAPFPWQWSGSLRMLLVVPEIILWWWILFYGVIPGLKYCSRNRLYDVLPLLIFILGMGLLYSVMFSNIGLIYRQRAQLLPWLLVFGALGIELRRLSRIEPGYSG